LCRIRSSLRLLLKHSFLSLIESFDKVSDRLVWLLEGTSTGPNLIAPSARNSKDDLVMATLIRKACKTSA
jgi:hypothetical protein